MDLWRDIENRLTPAARDALDELLEDIRRRTLLTADRRAYGDDITVSNIMEAFQFKGARASMTTARRRLRLPVIIAAIYAAIGGITASLGVLLTGFGRVDSDVSLIIAVSGAGLMMAAVGVITVGWMRFKSLERREIIRDHTEGNLNNFLSAWVAMELKVKLSAAKLLGESTSEYPLMRTVDALAKAGFLKTDEVEEFRDVAKIRNQAVHGATVDNLELAQAARRLTNLTPSIDRLANKGD